MHKLGTVNSREFDPIGTLIGDETTGRIDGFNEVIDALQVVAKQVPS